MDTNTIAPPPPGFQLVGGQPPPPPPGFVPLQQGGVPPPPPPGFVPLGQVPISNPRLIGGQIADLIGKVIGEPSGMGLAGMTKAVSNPLLTIARGIGLVKGDTSQPSVKLPRMGPKANPILGGLTDEAASTVEGMSSPEAIGQMITQVPIKFAGFMSQMLVDAPEAAKDVGVKLGSGDTRGASEAIFRYLMDVSPTAAAKGNIPPEVERAVRNAPMNVRLALTPTPDLVKGKPFDIHYPEAKVETPTSKNPPTSGEIIPAPPEGYVFTPQGKEIKPPSVDETRLKISAGGEAGKLPTARQQAVDTSKPPTEQERLMQGRFIPAGKIPTERLSAIHEGLVKRQQAYEIPRQDKVQPVPEAPKVPSESIFTPEFERFKSWVSSTRDTFTLNKTLEEWNKNAPNTVRDREGQRLVKERLATLAAEKPKTSKPWPPPEKYPRQKFYEGGGNTKQPEGEALGSVSDVLKRISENKESSFNELAGKLLEIGDKEGLAVKVFRKQMSPWLLGRYSPKEDNITVSTIHGETDHTHIHEIIHALTNKKLANEITSTYKMGRFHTDALRNYLTNGKNDTVKSLILMYNEAMKKLPDEAKKMYGMSDFQEFMAEGFSNPEFQRYLRREKAVLGNTTMWAKFVDAVKKLLGLKEVDDTLLSNVIDATGELSKQTRAEAGGHKGGETGTGEPKEVQSNLSDNLRPALKIKDQVVPGEKGQTHDDILQSMPPVERAKALINKAEHGFVDQQGKFLNRVEAAKLVGQSEPLHSETLREMQSQSRGATVRPAIKTKEGQVVEGSLHGDIPAGKYNIAKKGWVVGGKFYEDVNQALDAMEKIDKESDVHGMNITDRPHPSNPKTAWLYKPEGGQSPSVGDLLRRVASDPKTHGEGEAALADFYSKNFPHILDTVGVDIDNPAPGLNRSGWNPSTKKIYLNMQGKEGWEPTFKVLHEATHAAIEQVFEVPRTRAQRAAKTQIESMFKLAKAYLPDDVREFYDKEYAPYMAKNYDKLSAAKLQQMFDSSGIDSAKWQDHLYALTDPHEFLASISHSPDFRAYLNGIKVEGTTVLGRLKDAFKQLLGIKPGTVLEKTFEAIQKLADDNRGEDSYEGFAKKVEDARSKGMIPKLPQVLTKAKDDLKESFEHSKEEGKGLVNYVKRLPTQERQAQLMDASVNEARIAARQGANWLRVSLPNKLDREALTFLVEEKQGVSLKDMENKIGAANMDARKALVHADLNRVKLAPIVNRYERMMEAQRQAEQMKGIETDKLQGYAKHSYENEYQAIFDGGKGGTGITTSFKKGRVFPTYADAIAAGFKPKTFDLADLTESRLNAGMQLINRAKWGENLGAITDPISKEPLAVPLSVRKKMNGKVEVYAPHGYSPVQIIPGQMVAIHDSFKSMFQSLTEPSSVRQKPLSRAVLATQGVIKHGILLFDTYHATRMMMKQAFLMNYFDVGKKGLSVLEYNEPTLRELINIGDITQDQYKWAMANKPDADLLIKNGLNVGRVADNMIEWVHGIPGLRAITEPFNKLVFEKLTRGAMMETGLWELERQRNLNPGKSDAELAPDVAKQVNVYYGNLGKQGLIKDATLQDLSRILILAPQWFESMVQTELRSVGQLGLAVDDAVFQREYKVGMLAKGVGRGLVLMMLANQMVNRFVNGKWTWQNEENKDATQKLDLVIPIGGKGDFLRLNPTSTVAEITHDYMRYMLQGKGVVGSTSQILANKSSSLARASKTFLEGVNYKNQKLLTDKEIVKETGKALIPTPIPISGVVTGDSVQTTRAFLSSLGMKVEPSTYKEARERRFEEEHGGRKEEQGTIDERVAFTKEEKEAEPLPSPVERLAIGEKALENREKARREVETGLTPQNSKWLIDQKLTIPEVADDLHRVPLTVEEAQQYHKLLAQLYNDTLNSSRSLIENLPNQAAKKRTLNAVLAKARQKALREN